MALTARLLLLFVIGACLRVGFGSTDAQDAAALRSLKSQWQNTPPSWGELNDPCGTPWEGVVCVNFRVTMLKLASMGLKGTLSSDIGQLTQLQSLDLSYNRELSGTLTPDIGNLQQLTTLILAGCSFSGNIPQGLGSLHNLTFLDLNSNQFTGTIPASLGNLSNLYWLDLADNQLTGPLPVSTNTSPGLDLLLNTKLFRLSMNQLSGIIPAKLFNSEMHMTRLFLNANKFTGEIPASIALVKSLEVLRVDKNSLSGRVPPNINNLTNINELNLADNKLTGSFPNLSGMNNLNYVDLSNNTFDTTEAPAWFSEMHSLTVLVMESGGLYGYIPQTLFSSPSLQQVKLNNNAFNGTLNMGNNISSQLLLVNLENNSISGLTLPSSFNRTLLLGGNPVCNTQLSNATIYCRPQQNISASGKNYNELGVGL